MTKNAIPKNKWDAKVPPFNMMDYTVSLMKVFAFFAAEIDASEKQEIAILFWMNQGKDVTGLSKLGSWLFTQIGPLCWLAANNAALNDAHVKYLETSYHQLIAQCQTRSTKKEVEQVKVDPQILLNERTHFFAAEIDASIDEFVLNDTTLNIKEFLLKNEVPVPVMRKLSELYKPQLKEIELALSGKDEQLVEGYSYMTRRKLKKFADYLKNIVDSCYATGVATKAKRKPKATKEKPASMIVAKVQYLKESEEFNLKSEHPSKIVGASEVWIFNVKYRKLFQYVAMPGTALSVNGTSLQNWNPEASSGRTIRKPLEFFADVPSMTKRPLTKLFNDIKGVPSLARGRLSDDMTFPDT